MEPWPQGLCSELPSPSPTPALGILSWLPLCPTQGHVQPVFTAFHWAVLWENASLIHFSFLFFRHVQPKTLAQQTASSSESHHLKDPLSSNITIIKITTITVSMDAKLTLGCHLHALFCISLTRAFWLLLSSHFWYERLSPSLHGYEWQGWKGNLCFQSSKLTPPLSIYLFVFHFFTDTLAFQKDLKQLVETQTAKKNKTNQGN